MYQDWKVTRLSLKGNESQFFRYMTSDVDQDAVLTWDYESERMKPPTCTNPNYSINTFVGPYVSENGWY